MELLFTSTQPFIAERVHAMAVYCSDGRFGDSIDQFLHEHLELPNYDRLAIPGGAAWLHFRGSGSIAQHDLMRDQVAFLVEAHELERAVLIAHHGCAYYLRRYGGDAERVLPQQIEDLRDAARALRTRYPRLRVETYLARAEGGRVSFYAVPAP